MNGHHILIRRGYKVHTESILWRYIENRFKIDRYDGKTIKKIYQ